MHFTCGGHPDGAFWTKSGGFGPSGELFRGQKARLRNICRLKGASFADIVALLALPRGPPKVEKWVSDIYPVKMSQLDHYVVFGTKYGTVQDFQRGKKCLIGVKETPP